jgi:uncharacterized membrane protein YdfJ with MMPL/SSD domain
VIGWILLAVLLAPFACLFVLNVQPMLKDPPPGTDSFRVQELISNKFPQLVGMLKEMILIQCKSCATIVTSETSDIVDEFEDMLGRFNSTSGAVFFSQSYYTYGTDVDPNPMLSSDKKQTMVQWMWALNGDVKKPSEAFIAEANAWMAATNKDQNDITISATGPSFLEEAMKTTLVQEIPVHEFATIWIPFSILGCKLKSAKLLLLSLLSMPIAILVSFGAMYFVSLYQVVISYALMMMLMLTTALSFDYSLFTLTRYYEERKHGMDVEGAVVTVMTQSGHVVVVSGFVLGIAYASMLVLPPAFQSFCYASCSTILACVGVQLSWIPCVLGVCPFLGPPQACVDDAVELQSLKDMEQGSPESTPAGTKTFQKQLTPMQKVADYRSGMYYWSGGVITKCPFNLFIPLIVYGLMSPLMFRVLRFNMGHSFALQLPRHRPEWDVSREIAKSFSGDASCMMPVPIIATNSFVTGNKTGEELSAAWKSVNIRSQDIFDANCDMVNNIIDATAGEEYNLAVSDFSSVTFHSEMENSKHVSCFSFGALDYFRTSYLTNYFFSSTRLVQLMWEQMVNSRSDAMLTLINPTFDPFSQEAFDMVDAVNEVLKNRSMLLESANSSARGLDFTSYSATSVMMDIIKVTRQNLPIAFGSCVGVCFVLIAVSFRAAMIPIILLFTVIVPISWSYGAALYVYEDGVLEWLQCEALSPFNGAGIDWTVPIFTLTIQLGLALDYAIFLFERIFEFREWGFGDLESIQLGLSATGPIISAAGMIFAFTFISMLLSSMPVTNQIGFVFVFSIVVDTFVVRTILVPAMLSVYPPCNYWPTKMPPVEYRWLGPSRTNANETATDNDSE